jgi:NAD(P)-dependent dehydrogenase (short-subunit alcohol dehydrogenase family)
LDPDSPSTLWRAPNLDVTGEPLQGTVAVVTGASSDDALLEVQAGLEDGARSVIFPADVTDRAQVGCLISHTEEELGPVNVLVNCAGVMYYTLYVGHDLQEGARPLGEPHPLASEVRQGRYEK